MKTLLHYLAILALFSTLSTQAAPIVEADAFAAGDNKAMLDTTSGLVWMDHGITSSKSFNQVVSELDTTYKGWRLPTEQEVFGLFNTLFAHQSGYLPRESWWSSWDFVEQKPVTEEFISIFDIFGANSLFAPDQPYNWSWFLDSSNHLQAMVFYITSDLNVPDQLVGAATICCVNYGWNYDAQLNDAGWTTLLVRQDVPEPSTVFLLGLGLLGLGFSRRKTAQ